MATHSAQITGGGSTGLSPGGLALTQPVELTDTSEFEVMYRREYPGLVAVARALAGDDGPDLVHDAMVRALLNWRKIRRYNRTGGWCHRVVINLCRNRWRKKQNEQRYLRSLSDSLLDHTIDGPSTDTIVFWKAVRRLPERPRLVVTLYYAGEHAVTDIARTLNIPEGTVKSDLSRARAVLARELL